MSNPEEPTKTTTELCAPCAQMWITIAVRERRRIVGYVSGYFSPAHMTYRARYGADRPSEGEIDAGPGGLKVKA